MTPAVLASLLQQGINEGQEPINIQISVNIAEAEALIAQLQTIPPTD